MRFLLSNDDGYLSPGLAALARALGEVGPTDVVAPDRDRSGASNSLTLTRPLSPRVADNDFVFVDGTPTDCVHLALCGYLDTAPDLVVSGINVGPNFGDDVLYSGTVAAAMEGRYLGLPAIAVSLALAGGRHFDSAARVTRTLVERIALAPMPSDTILNVNVPDLPYESIRGYRATRLGRRHQAQAVVRAENPRGDPVYWVGALGGGQDAGPGTDFHAVETGFVSVTPLGVDLTRREVVEATGEWLAGGGADRC